MRDRRVVVTGLGAISALGPSVEESWRRARDGHGGIAMHTLDPGEHGPPPQAFPLARVAPGFDKATAEGLGPRACAGLDPFASYLLCAAFEAVAGAALLGDAALERRTAIVVGHGMGGVETLEQSYRRFYGAKSSRMHPTTVPRLMMSAGASAVAMAFGVHGPVFATSSACASSAHAITQGAALIKAGLADIAVVGGSEAVATPGGMCAWDAIHALSPATCRPFSKDRDGMVIGEGAGVLVLEEAEHAFARGAPLRGELVGMGMSSDAFHITQPSLEGTVNAIRQACEDPAVHNAESILISAHGTGTALNDENEAAAIRAVFGARTAGHPVIATKSAHGHLIGGSAAIQAVLGLRALEARTAPPVLNHTAFDPACDVDLVLGEARRIAARHLLLNAFAFGGLNVSLAFARTDTISRS